MSNGPVQHVLSMVSIHEEVMCVLSMAILPSTTTPCSQVTLAFPAVLDRLELKAFDMCKMIDAFVRHEPTLLKELRRHLFSVDEGILESLAWQPGSSLFPLIAMACSSSPNVCPIYLPHFQCLNMPNKSFLLLNVRTCNPQ